jgi:hypothetical protein
MFINARFDENFLKKIQDKFKYIVGALILQFAIRKFCAFSTSRKINMQVLHIAHIRISSIQIEKNFCIDILI